MEAGNVVARKHYKPGKVAISEPGGVVSWLNHVGFGIYFKVSSACLLQHCYMHCPLLV